MWVMRQPWPLPQGLQSHEGEGWASGEDRRLVRTIEWEGAWRRQLTQTWSVREDFLETGSGSRNQ